MSAEKDPLTEEMFFTNFPDKIQKKLKEIDLLRKVAKDKGLQLEEMQSYQQIKKDLAKLGYMV